MRYTSILTTSLAMLFFMVGCATKQPHSEFVKTVTFSALENFSFKNTLVTGMDFRKSEAMLLKNLSEQTISNELQARGFEQVAATSDFYAVVKWKKAVSAYADPFDHIDPYSEVKARRDDRDNRFASRLHLTVEIYESSTGNLFWRNDLPNIFDALQLTEERVVNSLRKAITNFPDRVTKDPDLPDIE